MKIVERYICEACGTEYTDKERCAECEDWHIRPVKIEGMQHVPVNRDAQGYPLSIQVRMEDGKTVEYER